MFAKEFGFTPEQVDELSVEQHDLFLVLLIESRKKEEHDMEMLNKNKGNTTRGGRRTW